MTDIGSTSPDMGIHNAHPYSPEESNVDSNEFNAAMQEIPEDASEAELAQRATDTSDPEVLTMIAAHPNANPAVYAAIINNPATDSDTLEAMTGTLMDNYMAISPLMVGILSHENAPASVLHDFGLILFAGGTNTETGETIAPEFDESSTGDPLVRSMYDAIINNDNTPEDVVDRMKASPYGMQVESSSGTGTVGQPVPGKSKIGPDFH